MKSETQGGAMDLHHGDQTNTAPWFGSHGSDLRSVAQSSVSYRDWPVWPLQG
jgi:hypothetical protein